MKRCFRKARIEEPSKDLCVFLEGFSFQESTQPNQLYFLLFLLSHCIKNIDTPSKKSYSDIEFFSPVSRSTIIITLAFWRSDGEKFPEGRDTRKPPRDFFTPLAAFLFGEVIP